MEKRTVCLLFIAALLCVPSMPSYAWFDSSKTSFSTKEMDLVTTMRELFAEYLTWQRIYMLETLSGSADVAKAQARFVSSQDSICGEFKTYLGDYNGSSMTDLFKQYNQLLADYASAEKNRGRIPVNINTIYDKADELANILSMANMNWTKNELLDLFKKYADAVTAEIDGQGNNPGSIDTAGIDSTFAISMNMADTFSSGIIKQYPAKFW